MDDTAPSEGFAEVGIGVRETAGAALAAVPGVDIGEAGERCRRDLVLQRPAPRRRRGVP